MAEMKRVLVLNNVRDPQSFETYVRGVHEVDEVTAVSLLSMGPENVVAHDDVFGAESDKEQMTEAAKAVGVEVAETDTKEDVSAKVEQKMSGSSKRAAKDQPEA